jgi:ribonuclease E
MTKRMLIDATHKEETRVAITDGNRLIEYDYESLSRKPLKGSIFLAKVTRVEPSLQAAFVNFGGNRHGFLPFSEIHPDYFRIPVSDREALMAEQEALLREHDEEAAREEQELAEQDGNVEEDKSDCDDDLDDHEDDEPDEVGGLGHHDDEEDEDHEDDEGLEGDVSKEEVEEKTKSKGKAKPRSKAKSKPKTQAHKIDVEEIVDTSGNAEEKSKPEKDGNKAKEDSADVDGNVAEDVQETDGNKAKPKSKPRRKPKSKAKQADVDVEKGEDDDGAAEGEDDAKKKGTRRRNTRGRRRSSRRSSYRNRNVETVGGDDINQEQRFRFNLRRKYKIQEVIKRGQIMLIQANKEERGNKGAAVGTYLSLPGRYCVLMPNSPRAGGVSRKIANQKDRARMRDIVKSLEVPKGMSVIIRTAGVSRTKTEIKRDLDYLMRLWDNIRELTLESSAPSLVYEEADLIKRAVRDLYTRDVEEVLVSGEEGFKTAKKFMKMMIPSHAKKVVEYKDEQLPLFNRYQIESQISEIGQPEVRLKSGGYLVINPTEALVSIDVNSGKATKGRHIEETALKTNLEAADEVARQLKLRDLGGLVVIDFIDMEDRRNNTKVERRMKEALSTDRARVQVGRISSFGLMELSRQRLSPSLTEAQYKRCPHCNGVGVIPSADAMSITVLRAIEEEGIRARAAEIIVCVNNEVALYILNHKRKKLLDIEHRYNFEVLLRVDDKIPACEHRIEVSKPVDKSASNGDNGNNTGVDHEEEDVQEENKKTKSSSKRRRGGRGRTRNNNKDEGETNNESQNSQGDENVSEEKEQKPKRTRKPRKKPVKEDVKDGALAENDCEEMSSSKKGRQPSRSAEKKDEIEERAEPEAKATPEKAEIKAIEEKAEAKPETKKVVEKEESVQKDYETVNKPPKEKKKGWWNRL